MASRETGAYYLIIWHVVCFWNTNIPATKCKTATGISSIKVNIIWKGLHIKYEVSISVLQLKC